MNKKILIVEDELKLADVLEDYLRQADYESCIVSDGNAVMSAVLEYQPALILLDVMLPNRDGLALCKDIRQSTPVQHIPIIITTAKVDEIDRLLGLELGADDYICKPYSPREVVARVKAVLRRQTQAPLDVVHGLGLDKDSLKATWNGQNLDLTAVEFALLDLMAASPGRIYSRTKLMENIYSDYRIVSERTIDSHIKKLRKKLADIDPKVELIHSIYGAGYKLESP